MLKVETGPAAARHPMPRSPLWMSTPRAPQYGEAEEEVIAVALSLLGGYLARPGGVAAGPEVLHAYLRLALHGLQARRLDILCFDVLGRLVTHLPLIHGGVSSLRYLPREVVNVALRARAHSVVLAEWDCGLGEPVSFADDATMVIPQALAMVGISLRAFCNVRQHGVHAFAENPACYRGRAGDVAVAASIGERELIARASEILHAHARRRGDSCASPESALACARRLAGPVTGPRVDLLWLDERNHALGCDSIDAPGDKPAVKLALTAACRRNVASVVVIDHVACLHNERERFALALTLSEQLALIEVPTIDVLLSDGTRVVSKVVGELERRSPAVFA